MLTYSLPGIYTCEVLALPPFKPNAYLLEHHRKEGQSDWEVFATAVREVMSRESGLPTIDCDVRDKVDYKKFLTGKIDKLEFKGKTFEAPPMRKKKVQKTE